MKRIKVVRRVPRRVPLVDAERFLNVAFLHAAPNIDVNAIQEGAWQRYVDRTKKKAP